MIYSNVQELLNYGLNKNLIDPSEEIYSRNLILDCLNLDNWETTKVISSKNIEEILNSISDYAIETKLINNSPAEIELFQTRVMNTITPRPKTVIDTFYNDFNNSPEVATKNYYEFSKNTNYIPVQRIERNLHWFSDTPYGDFEITINLAKPEKDPKDIEKEKLMPKSSYPSCLLCIDNVGYRGRLNHPARQTHRVIPMILCNEEWFFQFSPYVYYNEHSIVFSKEHRPMKIDKNSFKKLLEFTSLFPHYCIGSNADLPIVGGSILSHDHYQAGSHLFPMAKAKLEKEFTLNKFKNIHAGIVNWPMSVIRLTSENKEDLIDAADYIFNTWKNYSDLSVDIISETDGTPHNTVTPIARRQDNLYQIDLALRNNRTSTEHPMGIFHPHSEVHNIKKENIGLIEVMGLAILPGRLQQEMNLLLEALKKDDWKDIIKNDTTLNKHLNWIIDIVNRNQNNINMDILKEEIGKTFSTVLEHAGVFKKDKVGIEAFDRFIDKLN